MRTIKDKLTERKMYLEGIIEEKRSNSNSSLTTQAYPYSIHAIRHRQGYQYYRKDSTGVKYIKAQDMNQVRKIVQSEYDYKVLRVAEKEYKKIASFLKTYDEKTVESVYESMPAGKRKLVVPYRISDEEYLYKWQTEAYESLGFREDAQELHSLKGERMRSKSEMLIANLLDKMQIPYKYEKPLKLKHMGVVHPDFTILDVNNRREIYWEHLGMLDDQVYRTNAIKKIREYEKNGYYVGDRLIITEDSANLPLDIKSIERKVRFILDI